MQRSESWVAAVLARQDGVIARQQVLKTGMTAGQIRHRLETGRWLVVHPSVYRSADHRFTPASRIRSAGLWGGENGMLSGIAAAWWWGLPVKEPDDVEIVIPRNEHRRSRPGARIVRRDVLPVDRAWLRATAVTSLALSVFVTSAQLGPDGPALLDRALQTKLTMSELRACYYRNIGIAGSKAAGDLVRAAADRAAAASERLFLGLLKSAGITGWRVNHQWDASDRRTIDVAFVWELLAIEIDGWAWHHTPERFQADRNKQNDLTDIGWTVLRFTWFDLTQRPDEVTRRVRAHLDRAKVR